MTDIMIHIGLPKTATTTIQNHFFYNLPKDKFNYIFEKHFDKRLDQDAYRTYFLDQVINNNNDYKYLSNLSHAQINILSDESLTVPTFVHSTRKNVMCFNAKRLKEYFGANHNYRIMITLRNQVDWLYSLYVQLYGHRSLKKKLSRQYFTGNKIRSEIKTEADYYKLIQSYVDVFGGDSVEIFIFEEFVKDRELYFEKLANFLNINKSLISKVFNNKHSRKKEKAKYGYITDHYITKRYVRLISKLRKNISFVDNMIEKLKKMSTYQKIREKLLYKQVNKVIPYFTDKQKAIIKQTFADSNLKLAKEFGLDIEKMREYGYL